MCSAGNESGTWVYTSLRGWKKLPEREIGTGEGTYIATISGKAPNAVLAGER